VKDKILLFIPGYNCENQILRVLNQIDENVIKFVDEIIMVNNISTDSTEKRVIEYIKMKTNVPIRLLRNQENYGLGGSHKTAFNYAIENGFDYVIVLHGDDQGDIHDLLPILEKGIYKKYDCCLGARFMKGSILEGYSKFRTFGNLVYNTLFSIVVKNRIFDLGSGLNIYSKEMLKNKFWYKFPDKLTFNYCMIMAADYYKHKIMFFPISWREDDQISNVKMFNQAISVLRMLGKYFISKQIFIKSEFRNKIIEDYHADIIYESEKYNEEKDKHI
jgi:glycosyltransferase involved in cell wall biosynthesis